MGFNTSGVKVEETGLSVRYNYESEYSITESGETTSVVTSYLVRRYATKRYAYVGLSLEGAKALAAAKTAQYTKWHRDGDLSLLACQASISVNKGDAGYRVNIDVNEEDAVRVETNPYDPSSYFGYINGSNYDEDIGSMLTLISRTREGNRDVFKFSAKFEPINPKLFSVQYIDRSSYVGLTADLDAMTISTSVSVVQGRQTSVRLTYGNIESNVINYTE